MLETAWNGTMRMANCLFACVTNWQCATTTDPNSTVLYSDSGVFQTVGGGAHYLAGFSPYRSTGTTNIDSNLLSDLQQSTTYPPLLYSNTVLSWSSNMTLFPQIQRNTGPAPDPGYCYPAMDYELGVTAITNAWTMTIVPGTVIGCFGLGVNTYALGFGNGAVLQCQGAPTNLVRFVEYTAVQEQGGPGSMTAPPYMLSDYGAGPATINCRFTDFSGLARDTTEVNGYTAVFNLQDSQFHGGYIWDTSSVVNLTNCLLERVNCTLWTITNTPPGIRNNLFYWGSLWFAPQATNPIVRDCLFDHTSITGGNDAGYNAFVTGANTLSPSNATDLILSASPAYQAGPLGLYYVPTNNAVVNGDTNITADQAGLYHYTMYTNIVGGTEIKETNSWLDIGFHYIAVDSNGAPVDTDGDGAPDFLENAGGDGSLTNLYNWKNGSAGGNFLLVPSYLRCEYRQNPWGITTNYGPPRFYWIVTSPNRAEKQVGYEIIVGSSNAVANGYGDLWDSGRQYSDQTIHVPYAGPQLQSGQRLWWRVKTWDLYTGLSNWSTNGFFQVGLLSTNDWTTNTYWIGVNGYQPNNASPMYRSTNILLSKTISSATAYVSAKGVYELWANGYRIGNNLLAPEWTDYTTRIQYQTFDLTPYLTSGTTNSFNVLGAFVGEGWCYGNVVGPDYGNYYGSPNPQLALLLVITNSDLSRTTVSSDANWQCSTNGLIRFSSIYNGETDDANQDGYSTNWTTAGSTSTNFAASILTTSNVMGSQMFAQPTDPIQTVGYTNPIAMWAVGTNTTLGLTTNVYDMGQNMVGWCNLSVSNSQGAYNSGATIILRHAERLTLDSNNLGGFGSGSGNIDRANLGLAKQIDTYVLNSATNQQFHPHFTYHGFRYVEVTAPTSIAASLTKNSLLGCINRSGLAQTGSFWCGGTNASNPAANWVLAKNLINKLMTNILWSEQDNLPAGVFTSCTQRDERDGYLSDPEIVSQNACFNFDLAGLFTKWLRDIRDAQTVRMSKVGAASWAYGGYTDVAPWDNNTVLGSDVNSRLSYSDPACQAGGIIFPWRLYENYGDTRILAEHFQSMTNHIGYLASLCQANTGTWQANANIWKLSTVEACDWAAGDYFSWFARSSTNPFAWPQGHASASYVPWGTAWSGYSIDLVAAMTGVLGQLTAGTPSGRYLLVILHLLHEFSRNGTNRLYKC